MKALSTMAFGVALLAASPVYAESACDGFKWDVTREHALFLGAATPLAAAGRESAAPQLQPDLLYEVTLQPVEDVTFAVAPSQKKVTSAEGSYGGMASFRAPRAGRYRVSVGSRVWVDVAAQNRLLSPAGFSGADGCATPRKFVVYDLPEAEELMLELSGASSRRLRMTLMAESPPAP